MGARPDIGANILFCQRLHPDMQRPQALSSAHTFFAAVSWSQQLLQRCRAECTWISQ